MLKAEKLKGEPLRYESGDNWHRPFPRRMEMVMRNLAVAPVTSDEGQVTRTEGLAQRRGGAERRKQ